MPKCIDCGKKGLFLRLDKSGRCEACATLAAEKEQIEMAKERQKKQFFEEQRRKEQALQKARETYNISGFRNRIGEWYLVYSYTKVSIETDVTQYYHGDVEFLVSDNAVFVLLFGKQVGIMPDSRIKDMVVDFSERSERIEACFDSPTTLHIAFYKKLMDGLDEGDSILCKLIRSGSKDSSLGYSRYENLESIEDDDLVILDYDEYSECYIVHDASNGEIGEIGGQDSAKIRAREDVGDIPIAFATECDVTDSGRPTAKIRVFFK